MASGKELHRGTEVGGAVEVAVGDGFHDVVVEDVGASPVCGCYQKIQTIQLFEKPFEVGDGAGDFTLCLLATGLARTRWRG